jgi:hypothetical protein
MASRDDDILDYIFNPTGVPDFLLNPKKELSNGIGDLDCILIE